MAENVPPSPYAAYGTNAFNIPYADDKVLVEYVYPDHTRHRLMCKTKVLDFEPKEASDCPIWDSYMFNNFECKEPRKEMLIKPVAMFRDPFKRGRNKIVLCEFWETEDKPAVVNTRRSCEQLMKKVKDEELWFGMEQEYFILGDDGRPMAWDDDPKATNIDFYNKLGLCRSIGFERDLAELHLRACLFSGIKICGINREDAPSQWEYQIGPCKEIDLADQIVISRYLLWRIGELYGVEVSMATIPNVEHAPNQSSGGHINFSTKKMREEGGIRHINEAIEILRLSPQVLQYYDLKNGKDNVKRLSNSYFVPGMTFTTGVGDKNASVRIPLVVSIEGKGYFEDRRPAANADPYAVIEIITRACVLKEFIGTKQ